MSKNYFSKTIRKNQGGGANWKDNMKIIPKKHCVRIKGDDGQWSTEDQYGVFLPSGTCVIHGWIKTHDFDNNPYPDNGGRLEIAIKPWGTWTNKDGSEGSDLQSVTALGLQFNPDTEKFEKIDGKDFNKGSETSVAFQGASDQSVRTNPHPDSYVDNKQEATSTKNINKEFDDDIPW
tara:strand:+ start:1570 stop:2100 length:531 start_codon:yes stop_codon:yes gene_type:complete